MLAFAALMAAFSPQDYPHRDWGKVATLSMSVDEAAACIARTYNRRGGALVVPADGGVDIDATSFATIPRGEPWQRFKLRTAGDVTTMRVLFRRPLSAKRTEKDVRKLGADCLRISSIDPAA